MKIFLTKKLNKGRAANHVLIIQYIISIPFALVCPVPIHVTKKKLFFKS